MAPKNTLDGSGIRWLGIRPIWMMFLVDRRPVSDVGWLTKANERFS
jgi:hypothetical protein